MAIKNMLLSAETQLELPSSSSLRNEIHTHMNNYSHEISKSWLEIPAETALMREHLSTFSEAAGK